MVSRVKQGLLLLFTGLLFILCSSTSQAEPRFPEVEADVTDTVGILSEEDKLRLSEELEFLREFHYMPGVIVITDRTEEWDFIEYGHDFFDHLRSHDLLDHSSFLIYISIEDTKMAFILGNDIGRIIDPDAERTIRNELGAALKGENYFKGLSQALANLKALPGPVELEEARQQRGQWLILAGLIILIAVFLINLTKRRRAIRGD